MNKKIIFSFGDGLKGNISDKFDFTFKIDVYNINNNLLHSQSDNPELDLSQFYEKNQKIIIKITQIKDTFNKVDSLEFELSSAEDIISVTVSPDSTSIKKGNSKQFTAIVDGPIKSVIWSLENNISVDTVISSNGLLSVSEDETSDTLTVKATSTINTNKFGIAIAKVIEKDVQTEYLRMFSATDKTDPNFVSLEDVKNEFPQYNDYWYWIKFNGNIPDRSPYGTIGNIDKTFYKGMNDIRKIHSEPSVNYYDDLYRAQLFKLSMDTRLNALTIPEMSTYNGAMTYLSAIGISNIVKRHEIFLTYQLQVVNIIADKMSSKGVNWRNILDNRFSSIVEMLDRNKCFVFDWFSWEPISSQPSNGIIGGYSTSPLTADNNGTIILSNVLGHINMEPEASMFSPTQQGSNAENVAFPYRWKIDGYVPSTGWAPITRWDEEYGKIDPMTTQYELSDLRYDIEKQQAFAILDVLIHEMGHALCNYNVFINPGQPRKGYTTEWLSVGGWNTNDPETYYNGKNSQEFWSTYGKPVKNYYNYPGPAVSNIPEPSTSQYGGSHPLEDWAECYACYMLNEPYFKAMFPKKYAVMKNYLDTLKDLKLNSLGE